MMQRKKPVVASAVIAALALLCGCDGPTHDPVKLKAIKAEAEMLMQGYPTQAEVAKARWPRAIASLDPEFVSINPDGVHITMTAHFDGGSGYFVPRRARVLPEPVARFEEAGQGVYWWHPY